MILKILIDRDEEVCLDDFLAELLIHADAAP